MRDYVLVFLSHLVAFFDLITFFGLASFFAWLAYVPLQKDVLDEFRGKKDFFDARDNFYTINDYFLVSFLFYSAAIVFDYLIGSIPLLVGKSYGPDLVLALVDLLRLLAGACFCAGVVTLALPMYYMRRVGKGDMNLATSRLHGFDYALAVFGIATFDVVIAVSSMIALAPALSIYYSSWLPPAFQWLLFWGILSAFAVILGVVLTMNYFLAQTGFILGWVLILAPIIAEIVILYFHLAPG